MIEARTITFDDAGNILNGTAADWWKSLPPDAAIQLAKVCPRVAGPREVRDYRRRPGDGLHLKSSRLGESGHVGVVWETDAGFELDDGTTGSLEMLITSADDRMRANGWLLESEAAK
jgi:hypothetical protein